MSRPNLRVTLSWLAAARPGLAAGPALATYPSDLPIDGKSFGI